MIELASILSEGFVYARIDFYIINEKIFFGRMKFTSESGAEEYISKSFDKRLASLIKLPKLAYDIDTGEYHFLQVQNKTKVYSFLPYYLFLFILFFRFFSIYARKILYPFNEISIVLFFSKPKKISNK